MTRREEGEWGWEEEEGGDGGGGGGGWGGRGGGGEKEGEELGSGFVLLPEGSVPLCSYCSKCFAHPSRRGGMERGAIALLIKPTTKTPNARLWL